MRRDEAPEYIYRTTGAGASKGSNVADHPPVEDSLAGRPIYPYSVVRGGVTDRYELASAMARDAVVAAHYAGFDVSKARTLRLEKEFAAYVSYRVRDRIFWTSRKIPVRGRELLITDGRDLARTRCASRIALNEQEPTSPEEPVSEVFEMPAEPESLPEPFPATPLEMAEIPALPPLKPLLPPFYPTQTWPYGPPPVFPPTHVQPPPPTAVPEPGTLLLLGSGIAAALLVRRLTGK